MRRELAGQLELTPEQSNFLDNHSFLNLFNVLEQQLSLLDSRIQDQRISQFSFFCLDILLELPNSGIRPLIPKMEEQCAVIVQFLEQAKKEHSEEQSVIEGLLETAAIGHARIQEMKSDRCAWHEIPKDLFHSILYSFLRATEIVSGRRFRIQPDAENPASTEYAIFLRFNIPGKTLHAPFILNDIIRDLVANSRKYSNPGTRILVELSPANNKGLILKISDQGIGIPDDEIDKVIQYGYRATNVLDRRTMGDGLGLTKAFQFCKKFNGKFYIQSKPGEGTTVQLSVYPPL